MGSPEYFVSLTVEIHRTGEGWEAHEIAFPVEKRCVGFNIPKEQLVNFGVLDNLTANVAVAGVKDAAVKEGLKVGLIQKQQRSGLTA
jgi:hypothetical protein